MARFLSAPPSLICGFLSSSWPSFAAAIRQSWGHLTKRKKSYVKGILGPQEGVWLEYASTRDTFLGHCGPYVSKL